MRIEDCYGWSDWTFFIIGLLAAVTIIGFGLFYFVRWISRINETINRVRKQLGWINGWTEEPGANQIERSKLIRRISGLEGQIDGEAAKYDPYSPGFKLFDATPGLKARLDALEAAQSKLRKKKVAKKETTKSEK